MEASAHVDRQLIAKARHGDEGAFEELVRKYMQRAYYIALGFCGNAEDARDQSQEAFVKVYKNLDRYDPTYPFYPWFYKIIRNTCFNHLKARKRRPQTSLDKLHDDDGVQFADGVADPRLLASRNQDMDQLWRAIGTLNPIHREILVMRHLNDMTYKEMAHALDIPEGTVMSRLFHARKALQSVLDGEAATLTEA